MPAARDRLLITACLCLWAATPLTQEVNKRMLDDPLAFTGPDSLAAPAEGLTEVRIGLFAPGPEDPLGAALSFGAALAVETANAGGGLAGVPFTLVRRWSADPWRGGGREMVRLVSEDRVWAVVGSIDGASTHVAQQVATKAHVTLVAPVSGDPSLTHTRVPWIFRLPPDDRRQAALLAAEVRARGLARPGLITTTDHDGRTAAAEIARALEQAGHPPAFHLEVEPGAQAAEEIARRAAAFAPDAILLRAPPTDLPTLEAALRRARPCVPILRPWVAGAGVPARGGCGETVIVAPFAPGPAHAAFADAYGRRFGQPPGPAAAYAFDAANLVIDALRRGGPSRTSVRDQLASMNGAPGVSGTIHWDTGGGNHGDPVLVTLPGRPPPRPQSRPDR